MNAIEFLKTYRIYEDDTIYNSVDEIVGTISQLMEEYASLRQTIASDSVCHCCNLPDGEIAISSKALTDPNWYDGQTD